MKEANFVAIDYDNWDRKEIFEEYKNVPYFITVEVDVTRYVEEFKGKIKFYPFMTYIASRVVNENVEYRYATVDGKVGYFDRVDPLYTLLRKNNVFTHKVTEYTSDFSEFYKRFIEDKKIGEASDRLYADGYRPKNSLAISTMPNASFTHMSFMYDPGEVTEYIPFTTFGKYFERDGKWYCPISTEFFHEVNDGYHANKYYKCIEELIRTVDIDVENL